MPIEVFVQKRVARYYWQDDINCATTTLAVLSEHFDVPLAKQVTDAAVGMHGAGEYGSQCGLVEGTLMFLGILGRLRAFPDHAIVSACRAYAEAFEKRFESLSCAVLRPAGFSPQNPPHLCEGFTCAGIVFAIKFITDFIGAGRPSNGQSADSGNVISNRRPESQSA